MLMKPDQMQLQARLRSASMLQEWIDMVAEALK